MGWVHFGTEYKNDVTQRDLARTAGTEGVLYVGWAEENATARCMRRRNVPDVGPCSYLVREQQACGGQSTARQLRPQAKVRMLAGAIQGAGVPGQGSRS